MVLVVEGTGLLGSTVSAKLLDEGRRVRVMTATPERAARLAHLGADVVTGDLRDGASLARACQDVERVAAVAPNLAGGGLDGAPIGDASAQLRLVDAALGARVAHFVYVSSLGAAPGHPLACFRAVHHVEAHLRASKLSYTIVRVPTFMESWVAGIGSPILAQRRAMIVGPGRNPINTIAVEDVAHYVLLALYHPGARDRIIEIGGLENPTAREVAATFGRVAGRSARTIHLPLPLVRALGKLLRPFGRGTSELLTLAAHRSTSDQRFDPATTLAEFPLRLTTVEEFAYRMQRAARQPQGTEGASRGPSSLA